MLTFEHGAILDVRKSYDGMKEVGRAAVRRGECSQEKAELESRESRAAPCMRENKHVHGVRMETRIAPLNSRHRISSAIRDTHLHSTHGDDFA